MKAVRLGGTRQSATHAVLNQETNNVACTSVDRNLASYNNNKNKPKLNLVNVTWPRAIKSDDSRCRHSMRDRSRFRRRWALSRLPRRGNSNCENRKWNQSREFPIPQFFFQMTQGPPHNITIFQTVRLIFPPFGLPNDFWKFRNLGILHFGATSPGLRRSRPLVAQNLVVSFVCRLLKFEHPVALEGPEILRASEKLQKCKISS